MRRTTNLCSCAFLMDLSVAAFLFGLTRRAAELGASALDLGLLGGGVYATYTLCAFFLGGLSDRWGRRQVATLGTAITIITALLCAFTVSVPWLLVLGLTLGIGISLYWPAIIAWLGEGAQGTELARRLAQFSTAWNVGLLLGFALTGWLFQYSPEVGFYVAAAAALFILVLLQCPTDDARPVAPIAGGAEDNRELPISPLLPAIPQGRGFRKTAWLASFGVNFCTAVVTVLFPQLATTLDIESDVHGGLLALSRFAALIVFWAMQYLVGWRTRLWPLWVAQIICAAAVTVFGFATSTGWFAVAFLISGAVSGYVYQASLFFTLEEMTEKGKGGGFHEAMIGSGMFLGPILAGLFGNKYGLATSYYATAVCLLLVTAIQLIVVALRRR